MKQLNLYLLSLLLFSGTITGYGQYDAYRYEQKLLNTSPGWNKIILPKELFGRVRKDLNDIRIIGVHSDGDSLEAPYVIKNNAQYREPGKVSFRLTGHDYKKGVHYFIFSLPSKEAVNEIKLRFRRPNFDWNASLEGSNDQRNWKLISKQRLLSLHDNDVDYEYSEFHFTSSVYRFYRVGVEVGDNNEEPNIIEAIMDLNQSQKSPLQDIELKKFSVTNNKKENATQIDIELERELPVGYIEFKIANNIDYFRELEIQRFYDSIQDEGKWDYRFQEIERNTISSVDQDGIRFSNVFAKKLRVLIFNNDNKPLNIEGVNVKGPIYEVLFRLDEPAEYFLVYGNDEATSADYDINRFMGNIPDDPNTVSLGTVIEHEEAVQYTENNNNGNNWLIWLVIIIVVGVSSYLTYSYLKKFRYED